MGYTMGMSFGTHLRALRAAKKAQGAKVGYKSLAARIQDRGVSCDPTYIAHMEAGRRLPKNPDLIIALAHELDEDPDVFLAMAGYISPDLRERIAKRPEIFRACIMQLRDDINSAAERKVRDGALPGKSNLTE